MLRRHERDILNYFRMPIDNGTVEGLNNKAKLIIHRAYGFRTAGNYIRNLYHVGFPIWLWYLGGLTACRCLSAQGFRGALWRDGGDTLWVNYKPSPFSSHSMAF